MKGIVFIALNQMIEDKHGIDFWEELIQRVQPESGAVYTSVGSYSDGEIALYIQHLSEMLDMKPSDILRLFGNYLFTELNKRFSVFTRIQPDIISFFKSIECVIHKEVCKLYKDANLPNLSCEKDSDNSIVLVYRSPRKLCYLAEGLISGAANHYDFDYILDHSVCMHHGSDHCLFRITEK